MIHWLAGRMADLWIWYSDWRKARLRQKRIRQILSSCGCCTYCRFCDDPLNDQAEIDVIGDGKYTYTCTKCGSKTSFDFDMAPVPIQIPNPQK